MEEILRDGDILVLKAGEHWISKGIAMLTGSDVSHAAMIYDGKTIVEMELDGIRVTPFTAREGDTAYVMRLNPELPAGPLLEAADAYIQAKTRYDIPALVILGGLLIYRVIRPTPELVVITDLILRAAARALDRLIQTVILHNPDQAMVCSQLVYQIYRDGGSGYEIHLEGGTFQGAREEDRGALQKDSLRLIDCMDDAKELFAEYESPWEDPQELARRLCEVLQRQGEEPVTEDASLAVLPLLGPAGKLLELLEEFLEKAKADIPVNALFVTPADFVYHAKNLRLIKTVEIVKDIT